MTDEELRQRLNAIRDRGGGSSVTGDFGPQRQYLPPRAASPMGIIEDYAAASAPPPTPEQSADYRRIGTLGQLGRFNPEAQRRYEAADDPIGPQLGTGSRYFVDFAKTLASGGMQKAGRLGQLTGIGSEDANTLADPSFLQILSENNPPQSPAEGYGRGGLTVLGFGGSVFTDPGVLLAGPAGRLGGASYLGKTMGGLAGFTAPEMALQYAEGQKTLGEAISGTVSAGPQFIADVPGMAYRTGEALYEGEPIRAGEEAAPLVLMGVGKLAGRKKGTKPNERQVVSEAQGQRQGRQERLLSAEAPTATKAPVAAEGVAAPESMSVKPSTLPPEQTRTLIPEKIQGTPPPMKTGEARIDRQPVPSKPTQRRSLGIIRGDVEIPRIGPVGPEMYAQDMIGIVERQGGPYGRAVANRARDVVDFADRISGSQQNRILGAEDIIRRSPDRLVRPNTPDANEASVAYGELAEPRWLENVPNVGFSGLLDAVEHGGEVGPRAKQFVDRYNNIVRRQFRIGQTFGTDIKSLEGDLVNLGGRTKEKFIRTYTPEAYQLYQQKGKLYREFVDAISKLNGIKFEKAEQAMSEIFEPSTERTVAIEKARAIKVMPTHFKASDGRVYSIMEADPIRALHGAVRNMSDKIAMNAKLGPGRSQTGISPNARKDLTRLRTDLAIGRGVSETSFNKTVRHLRRAVESDNSTIAQKWGDEAARTFKTAGGADADFQNLKGMVQRGLMRRGNRIQQLRAKFAERGGNPRDYDNLIKSLSNRPLGSPDSSRSTGGKFKDAFKRVASGLEGTYRSLLLTAAAPSQVFEVVGATAPLVGIRSAIQGLARLSTPKRMAAERELLRKLGAITTEQMNIRLTPGTKIEDYFRLQNKMIRTVSLFDPINEANETVGAAMGRAFSDRIRKGNLSATDKARLAAQGFDQRQIERFNSKLARKAEYDAITRRVAKLQGTTLRRAEQSPWANSPGWRMFAPFQNYFQNTLRNTNRITSSLVDSVRAGDPKRIAASLRVLTEYATGRTAQGAGILFLTSLLSGRDTERGETVGESPVEEIRNNIGTAMWGGTLKSIADFVGTATGGGGVSSENVANKLLSGVSAPYRLAMAMMDAVTGSGQYQGLTDGERALKFIQGSVPLTKFHKARLAAIGHQDPVMESAVSKYWQWMAKTNPDLSKSAKPANAAFNAKIKQAVVAIRNGRPDDAQAIIDEALAAEPDRTPGDVRGRISGKKLLTRLTSEQIADLRKELGEKHFKAVETYDALMDNFTWSSENAGVFFAELGRLRRLRKETGARTDEEAIRVMDRNEFSKWKRFEDVARDMSQIRSRKDKTGYQGYQSTIDRVLKEQYERK